MRAEVEEALDSMACSVQSAVVASWRVQRTPREFLARHRTGAQFSVLPEPVKKDALRQLGDWAAKTFGSLDAVYSEQHAFQLRVFKFDEGANL